MSAETYFNGMLAKERRLTNLGLSAYPSDQEVFEFTLQLAEKLMPSMLPHAWNPTLITAGTGKRAAFRLRRFRCRAIWKRLPHKSC